MDLTRKTAKEKTTNEIKSDIGPAGSGVDLGLISNGTQTITGEKIFQNPLGAYSGVACLSGTTSTSTQALLVRKSNIADVANNRYVLFQRSGPTNQGAIERSGATSVAFVAVSDERLKENIRPLEGDLNKIKQLTPIKFNFKGESEEQEVGFSAQNMKEVYPEAVSEFVATEADVGQPEIGQTYYKIVGWNSADAILVSAIKELAQQVEDLKSEVALLKNAQPTE